MTVKQRYDIYKINKALKEICGVFEIKCLESGAHKWSIPEGAYEVLETI